MAGADNDSNDYRVRLDSRIGYGFAMRARDGVLTLYSEMTLGATDSYRFGMNWKVSGLT